MQRNAASEKRTKELQRADALRNRERILDAAQRMLERSPSATLVDIAAAAGVARSTLHRRFANRDELLAALRDRPHDPSTEHAEDALPAGRLGRDRPVHLDAIQVFDVVPPAALPEQLVAEAQRIARVPVALYVLDIDGTHLLHMAGPSRPGLKIEAPLAIGPELDADGLSELRRRLADLAGAEVYALWLRGRAIGVMIAFGRPAEPLTELGVAEAQRIARVPVALYVLDIDGTHLLHMAGPSRPGLKIEATLAIGPELDADGLSELRRRLAGLAGAEAHALWLRGRAIGVLIAFGRPAEPLTELARQAAAAITLADRYTDAFAMAQRRKQPTAAAEIQQSLLPPRITRVTGGEVAGNVLPSYEVAGDWFDVIENANGLWITLADGLGDSTRAAASSAVALGALRASRRSGADLSEALVVMHQTLREMPGRRAEMTAVAARWDPASGELHVANCGHVPPVILRGAGEIEHMSVPPSRGLGGRASPKPTERTTKLGSGDRLVMVSDGIINHGEGNAGLGVEGLVRAALSSERETAADTVREIHRAVLDACEGNLDDDATAVCLSLL